MAAAAEIVRLLEGGGVAWVRGPMFAGKSELLCDVWHRLEGRSRAMLAYSSGDGALDSSTHDSRALPRETIYTRTLDSAAARAVLRGVDWVLVDEVQWFAAEPGGLQALRTARARVVVVGLSADFRMQPFAGHRELAALCAAVYERVARCAECDAPAPYTRLAADATAKGNYMPHASYQPVCLQHHPDAHHSFFST